METVDAVGAIAMKLKEVGSRTPVYVVSSAADALIGSVGLHELGVSGVFLKPADPAVVIQTLKTRLGVRCGGKVHARDVDRRRSDRPDRGRCS